MSCPAGRVHLEVGTNKNGRTMALCCKGPLWRESRSTKRPQLVTCPDCKKIMREQAKSPTEAA